MFRFYFWGFDSPISILSCWIITSTMLSMDLNLTNQTKDAVNFELTQTHNSVFNSILIQNNWFYMRMISKLRLTIYFVADCSIKQIYGKQTWTYPQKNSPFIPKIKNKNENHKNKIWYSFCTKTETSISVILCMKFKMNQILVENRTIFTLSLYTIAPHI